MGLPVSFAFTLTFPFVSFVCFVVKNPSSEFQILMVPFAFIRVIRGQKLRPGFYRRPQRARRAE